MGREGLPVNAVLVTQVVQVDRESYSRLLVEATARVSAVIASDAGRADIEEISTSEPESVVRLNIDPLVRLL